MATEDTSASHLLLSFFLGSLNFWLWIYVPVEADITSDVVWKNKRWLPTERVI